MKIGRLGQILFLVALGMSNVAIPGDYTDQRLSLVEEIEQEARRTAYFTGRQRFDARVLEAIGQVPRHLFVKEKYRPYAYRNQPLPIGYGQTISQPYIVALMTDLLEPVPGQVVLEVGTGSGYQAAILAVLGLRVYTVEIIKPLATRAKSRLDRLGYTNVTAQWADGYNGWKEYAPFDAIIVTAASSHIPPPLIAQLKPGGRMVIPVGTRFMTQQLLLIEKNAQGKIRTRQILPVLFVPLLRKR